MVASKKGIGSDITKSGKLLITFAVIAAIFCYRVGEPKERENK